MLILLSRRLKTNKKNKQSLVCSGLLVTSNVKIFKVKSLQMSLLNYHRQCNGHPVNTAVTFRHLENKLLYCQVICTVDVINSAAVFHTWQNHASSTPHRKNSLSW